MSTRAQITLHIPKWACRGALLLVAAGLALLAGPAPGYAEPPEEERPEHYIVVLKAGESPDEVSRRHGLVPENVYTRALNGFSAHIPSPKKGKVKDDSSVLLLEPDRVVSLGLPDAPKQEGRKGQDPEEAQTVPTGVRRIWGTLSPTAKIDGIDVRVNADIAIIDTGIDLKHPDLNVVANVTFVLGTKSGGDDNGHGTHVAGTAAALDNGIGVVGVAPGARLHAVKVLNRRGQGFLSWVIAGVDWVTQRAGTIEVANMSLSCACQSNAFRTAIQNSVAAGVTYVVSAGNRSADVSGFSPAGYPEVITVSAMADSDGQPGGQGSPTPWGDDDTFASFSNFGSTITTKKIEFAAPGVNIFSTYRGGDYATLSGTSMAAPHVTGAAGLYKAKNANAKASPARVREALQRQGVPQHDADGFTGDPDHTVHPSDLDEPLVSAKNL